MAQSLLTLAAIDDVTGLVNVVIDTPRHSRCKYKLDPATGHFRLGKLLPLGAVFPYPFGFVPATLGEDGDPLDLLVIVDEPLFAGCVAPVRLLGVMQGEQRQKGESWVRNDRLIGAIETPFNHPVAESLDDLGQECRREIEHFFVSYNQFEGREFRWVGTGNAQEARSLIERGSAEK